MLGQKLFSGNGAVFKYPWQIAVFRTSGPVHSRVASRTLKLLAPYSVRTFLIHFQTKVQFLKCFIKPYHAVHITLFSF